MRTSRQITHTIEELISAIQENRNIAEIRQIISGIEDINQANEYGQTALYWAASNGRVEIVTQLLAAGADVNIADSEGTTPLYIAAFYGFIEVVEKLLDAGSNVRIAERFGTTPIDTAIFKGHKNIISKLIAYGADETLLTEERKAQYAKEIAEGILNRNTRSSALALANIGRELQRVTIMQNHPCREAALSQVHEKKLLELPESILALVAVYGAERQYPNNLNGSQSMRCAQLGTYSLEAYNDLEYFHYATKFADREPQNTIARILNGANNPGNGHSHQI